MMLEGSLPHLSTVLEEHLKDPIPQRTNVSFPQVRSHFCPCHRPFPLLSGRLSLILPVHYKLLILLFLRA